MSRVVTIEDDDGEVWTGREVDTSNTGSDVAAAVLSLGLTAIGDALSHDSSRSTVRVNGEEHTGKRR